MARTSATVYTPLSMRLSPPRSRSRLASCLVLALCLLSPREAEAQEGLRVGLTFGGTGFVGASAEWMWGDHGAELLVTTFAFRDVSVSVTGKQYFGAAALRPLVGAGLWLLTGNTPEGRGTALVARFPVGGDWRIAPRHYLTGEIGVSRGLEVWRPDPQDDTPLTTRLIPIPGLTYRWQTRP